jgi:hypothetical protein
LSVWVRSFIFHGTETLAGSEVPVLDLTFRVYCCEDVSGFEIGVFGSPGDVWKRCFLIVIGQCVWKALFFHIVDLNGPIVTGWMRRKLPAAMYLSSCENLAE